MLEATLSAYPPRSSLPARPDAQAIAQFLALASAANVSFDLVDERLVMRASRIDWRRWAAVRFCLDELGVEAIEAYFRGTTAEERAALAAAAEMAPAAH